MHVKVDEKHQHRTPESTRERYNHYTVSGGSRLGIRRCELVLVSGNLWGRGPRSLCDVSEGRKGESPDFPLSGTPEGLNLSQHQSLFQ